MTGQQTRRPGWKKRLRYRFDNLISRSPGTLVLWLGMSTLLIISLVALTLTLTGLAPGDEPPYTFAEAAWLGLLRTLGGGSIGGRGTAWAYRFIMLGMTLSSLFVFSTLISTLTNTMRTNLDELRMGRSEVIESDHTVILGWSEQIFIILAELAVARRDEPGSAVVILAERDKLVMEDQVRKKLAHAKHLRIVCRSGSPMEMADLQLISLNTSRNIIVLPPESGNPDAEVIKIVLAILNHPNRRAEPYHIVAGIRDPKNSDIASVLGRREVEWIAQGEVIARIIAQTNRQAGLSLIYQELLDFGSDEIYLHSEPSLVGKTFGEAQLAAEHDIAIGLYREGQKPRLAPPMNTVIRERDTLVVISKDNASMSFNRDSQALVFSEHLSQAPDPLPQPESTLILGWSWRGPRLVSELDHYLSPGSHTLVVADPALVTRSIAQDCLGLDNHEVCYLPGDTTDRAVLESLGMENFQHVVVLAYTDTLTPQQADAQTMMTLLHVRDIADSGGLNFSIVTEMLDLRNRSLVDRSRPDDFIISDRLISLMMAQVAENRVLNSVFMELFDAEGVELYLKPASLYVEPGCEINFYTVAEAARQRGEVAVGYREQARSGDREARYGVVINPNKRRPLVLAPADQVIVLAQN
jgi:ion channel POLLUX/CASTOR